MSFGEPDLCVPAQNNHLKGRTRRDSDNDRGGRAAGSTERDPRKGRGRFY